MWVSVRVISTAQYVMVNKSYDPSDRKELEPVVETLADCSSLPCVLPEAYFMLHMHIEKALKKKKKKNYAEFGSGLGLCIAF